MNQKLHVIVFAVATGMACASPQVDTSSTVDASPGPCAIALAPSDSKDQHDREITRLQARARAEADRGHVLEQLGYRYVARARARNDAGDYTLAEKTAECLAASRPDDFAALLLRGHVLHQLHRFTEAEQIARTLVKNRGLPLDHGLLGDVLMEQGRLDEAARSYQKMIDLKPFYQSYTRAAHLRWLKGDLNGAMELMRIAIAAASRRDPESIAWAYTRLGLYELQRGRLHDAARAVDAALQYQPDYAAALLTRGRILMASDRHQEARETLRHAARRNPLPEYQWALADALRKSGSTAEADAVERHLEASSASDPRTVALFLATRRTAPAKAIALAEHELHVRADVFTLDALAWSLASAGRTVEAQPLMQRAVAEGTQDGRLFLHAASIAASAGDAAAARRWLARASAQRATLLPSELDELVTLQRNVSAIQEN